jgi:putative two-component system response regulator
MALLASEPLLHRMKILIVDDEEMSVVMLEHFLRGTGYTRLRSVRDSRDVVDVCASFDPDLILLDLIMPNMDGYSILEKLRAVDDADAFLPIVVLTADTTEEAKEHALEAGATDFLVKPVSRTEALLRIRNLLEIRRVHLLLENQRAALEDAVRRREVKLRAS